MAVFFAWHPAIGASLPNPVPRLALFGCSATGFLVEDEGVSTLQYKIISGNQAT
jgi:hypothetical protein